MSRYYLICEIPNGDIPVNIRLSSRGAVLCKDENNNSGNLVVTEQSPSLSSSEIEIVEGYFFLILLLAMLSAFTFKHIIRMIIKPTL